MTTYILRRCALIPLTLLGILTLNFIIIQFAPGGPVERVLAELQGLGGSATGGLSAGSGETTAPQSSYRGAQGLDPAFVAEIEAQFGFDQPAWKRYLKMIGDYAAFDLGESYYRSVGVGQLIVEKLPVSLSLGLWSTLLIYGLSIPLGIFKAVRDGSPFDVATSWAIVIGYAVPGFMVGVLLIVLFSGGSFFDVFPLRGLTSSGWESLPLLSKIADYFWHLVLPVTSLALGGFAALTMLTKNAFLEEINRAYVTTARAKGLPERRVLTHHIFRNAMLIVIAGFPATLVSMLFTGSLLIEVVFSLDGIGLLGYEAVVTRDYPVVFGTLYVFGLIGLVLNLITDITYHFVDPRIDFEARRA